jgi:hypothetical protein
MKRWKILLLCGVGASCCIAGTEIAASAPPPGYAEAERAFQSGYTVRERVTVQVYLAAAGYWNSVANENFSQRLFNSIQRF